MGRVLIANLDDTSRAQYLARVKLVPFTPRTIIDGAAFQKAVERARIDGFAIVDQEFETGLRSVAVPVHDRTGEVMAAINVGLHVTRATTKVLRRDYVPVLQRTAADISKALPAVGRQEFRRPSR